MAIYSYKPLVIPGPYGTVYDFKRPERPLGEEPEHSQGEEAQTDEIKEICIFNDRHYIEVADDVELPAQFDEIDFKADTIPEEYTLAKTLETLHQQEVTLNAQVAQLKDQLLTATLADDTEQVAAIKAEYQNLVGA